MQLGEGAINLINEVVNNMDDDVIFIWIDI